MKKIFIIIAVIFALQGCTPPPPDSQTNACKIFKQYPSWYWAAEETEKKWGVPISVQMAILHQESHFNGNAKPPREKLLWVIPWKRPTTAKGYSQALNGTWKRYEAQTNHKGSRNAFKTACDFVGWYGNQAHKKAGVDLNNAYELYLAYHEGIGGYTRGTYKKKPWLMHVADKVNAQANTYHYQLVQCQKSLPKKPWYHVW